MVSGDATNYYERIHHAFTALTLLAFGVLHSAIHTILLVIQFMTFHLRTSYGESTQTCGGSKCDRYMGLYQGDGAVPA
jgi:hypothetical protein